MSHFVRFVDNDIVDFFVREAEGICYGVDEFLQETPYLLRHGELHSLSACLPEEFADSFVIGNASCGGEQIILDGADCGGCNLGCESVALAFAESKVTLAILEELMRSFS